MGNLPHVGAPALQTVPACQRLAVFPDGLGASGFVVVLVTGHAWSKL